jgi:protein gp37
MNKTKISWCDTTWNVATGCTPVSEGCRNCYAARYAKRGIGEFGWEFRGLGPNYDPIVQRRKFCEVRTHPKRLETPLHWRKPRKIFVCSVGDLFHESVPDEFIDKVFGVMALCPQHTFQVLTKRPGRMLEYFKHGARTEFININAEFESGLDRFVSVDPQVYRWPFTLPNIWLGVTAENQAMADERVPLLLHTPAAMRFVSVEPMLGPIDLSVIKTPDGDGPSSELLWIGEGAGIDWVIVGGETGPGARPMQLEWARAIVQQCKAAGVPCHVKQLPVNGKISKIPEEWPEDLRVREFPK